MAALSDISFECCHFYLRPMKRMTTDERRSFIRAEISQAQRWLGACEAMFSQNGGPPRISSVVMIDDYFLELEDLPLVDEVTEILISVCEETGFDLHWIAFERDLAGSVQKLLDNLDLEATFGEGTSLDEQEQVSDWISNGEPAREQRNTGTKRKDIGTGSRTQELEPLTSSASVFDRGGTHSVHLDVEFIRHDVLSQPDARPYSCPLLASWWQLIRLGVEGDPVGGEFRTRKVSENAEPLPAKSTLSLLDPRFISVEHAVTTILEHVWLPPEWRSSMRSSAELPGERAHLDRISYIFAKAPRLDDSVSSAGS